MTVEVCDDCLLEYSPVTVPDDVDWDSADQNLVIWIVTIHDGVGRHLCTEGSTTKAWADTGVNTRTRWSNARAETRI